MLVQLKSYTEKETVRVLAMLKLEGASKTKRELSLLI